MCPEYWTHSDVFGKCFVLFTAKNMHTSMGLHVKSDGILDWYQLVQVLYGLWKYEKKTEEEN